MKVSAAMIAYNQERCVAQAIESVLAQKTRFDWELIIGEDRSTDATRAVCEDYCRRYPERIRLLLQPTNAGMMRNFMQTLELCRGTYVAICEGDDYWTDPYKLQKQVDFLDAHPDFAICFHNVRVVWDDGSRMGELLCPPDQKAVSRLDDLLRANFIPTPAVMFRNHLFGPFPDWFAELQMADWPLHILNARHGKIGYLDEVMAVYRRHGGNTFASRDVLRNYRAILQVYERVERHVQEADANAIRSGKTAVYGEMCLAHARSGRVAGTLSCGLAAIALAPGDGAIYVACFRALKLAFARASARASSHP